MADLPETYFVLIDYELPNYPGLTFRETPAGTTLKDVFISMMDGTDTAGKVRGIYRANPGEAAFEDRTHVVARTLVGSTYLHEVEREFLEFHGYATQIAAE